MGERYGGWRPTVALCSGKDCVKDEGYAELREALSKRCSLRETRCLGLCKGPMVIVGPDEDEPVVLKRVSKPKRRRDLLAMLLSGAGLTERLSQRIVTGKPRRSALQKAKRSPKKS